MKQWLPIWLCLFTLATPLAARAQSPASEERLAEVEKKLDAALAEIGRMQASGVDTSTSSIRSHLGFAPAASKVYAVASGLSVGGYGEMLLESFDRQREDGELTGRAPQLDLYRVVFYLGHKFSDELLFNSELEWEHSGVFDEASVEVDPSSGQGAAELSGESTIEFAYLDWSRHRAFGVRVGKVLVPMGLVNEQHEPPVYLGARRPDVERILVPSTWGANGVGVYGEVANGFEYRAYVLEGLDANGLSAASTIRGGRQSGSSSATTHPAFAARLDWRGTAGLVLGASGYTADTWQDAQPTARRLSPRVSMLDLHARWQWRGLQTAGLWVQGTLTDAGALSDARGLAGSARLGERFSGGYLEAAYDVLPTVHPGTRYAFLPYVRFESYDTQDSVPGGSESPANERTVLTVGAAFKPHPNVVIKADRQQRSNDADTETDQWNMAVGWMF
ncbi:MAG: hypothetical protein ABIU54_12850 [Candidatus Eisenbacteria bacterium]